MSPDSDIDSEPQMPYPGSGGMLARLRDLERRIGKIEGHEFPVEIAVILHDIAELKADVKAAKHGVYAACVLLVPAVGVLSTLLVRG